VLTTKVLGRGWRPMVMVNNEERRAPLGDDPASAAVEEARQRREPTGLDEGRAWRHRASGSLVVVRAEVFADRDPGAADAHREAWRRHGEAALDATWLQRWRERDREPGWIEARWIDPSDEPGRPGGPDGPPGDPAGALRSPGVDHLRVEDHTAEAGAGAPGSVVVYEHVTVWHERRQVTVVVRHPLGLDLDDLVGRVAEHVADRLRAASG
jgi:hypothetical protein